jgi:hypothetical protein
MEINKPNLTSNSNLAAFFVSNGATSSVRVVEHDGNSGFCDTSLPLFVNKFLQIASSDLLKVRDAENKAYGVENVGLPGSIQASDGIEERVEGRDDGTRSIGFEAFQRDLLDVHVETAAQSRSLVFYPIGPSFCCFLLFLSSFLSSFRSLLQSFP